MDRILLDSALATDITTVSNFFIDEYMPKANGDFVKIYLQLLRLVNGNAKDFSMSMIADIFNFTEGDVFRALKYWEGLGLLTLSINEDNSISGIHLEPFGMDKHVIKGVSSMNMNNENNYSSIPSKKKYTPDEVTQFAEDEYVGQLMFLAQAYLGKPLSSTDINSLLYMYDSLALSTDFIEYIMETCISEGHKSLSYIEKTATSFVKFGITDIKKAKAYKKDKSALNQKVFDAFGIVGRVAGKTESEFILKWSNEYGFEESMIIEACNRTLIHTHAPSFKYADSILSSWHNSGVKKVSEIAKLDEQHATMIAKKYETKKASGVSTPKLKGGHKIEQRTYDYPDLEKQLLNKKRKKAASHNL